EKNDRANTFSFPTPEGTTLLIAIDMTNNENETRTISGHDHQQGRFSLSTDATGKISGHYYSIAERKAYSYTTDEAGNLITTTVAIESLLCMDYTRAGEIPSDEAEAARRPARTTAIPKYNSKPDSKFVIYIDLDGESGNSEWGYINALPLQTWTDAEVFEIWQVPAQDFLPWDINVTTDRAVYDAQPLSRKMMCIVTKTLDAAGGQAIGGIAHIGSFGSSYFDPCWVFNKGVKKTGETISHEVGHTVGLNHDGKGSSTYYQGHNNWAPIMGAAYSTTAVKIDDPNWLGQWSKGEYNGATNGENDLGIIASNGFGVRPDEHANTPTSAATALVIEPDGSVLGSKNKGIIHNSADQDVFKFTIAGGDLNLTAAPYYSTELNRFPNLNIKLRLFNSSGTAIATVDSLPPTDANTWNAMSAAIKMTGLSAGTYYLEVDGTKQGASGVVGYSDYCSIGGFNISGVIPRPVSIQEEEKIAQLNIYPNPTTGIFFITFHTTATSSYKLSVINALGQIVYEEMLTGFSGAYSNQLSIARYGKGVYTVCVADDKNLSTKRLVIR
ncbi:MAG: zinc-dependent metalloprotease, partial [Flavobacterium sp.]